MLKNTRFKVLLDTNILIYGEDNDVITKEIQQFYKLSNYFDIIIDEGSYHDINRDKNEKRKKIIKSKLGKYKISDFKLEPNEEYYKIIGLPKNDNDKIDDKLLYSLKCGACNFLITEDKGIHKKSLRLGVKDGVFSIRQFNKYILGFFPEEGKLESLSNVIHEKVKNIDIDDEIFDSLKEDYPKFKNWFRRIATEERKGFILKDDTSLMGICLYDDTNEDYLDGIKISTFKVSEKKKGTKSGELLLRQMFLYGMKKGKRYLYIEVKIDKYILEWLKQFGFYEFGFKNKDKNEAILRKDIFNPKVDRGVVNNYPFFYFGKERNIYLIPIQSKYSVRLFPDVHSQTSLGFDVNVCGNTIKKSYLSKSRIKLLKQGDIVFFYETSTGGGLKEKNQEIIAFGIIDGILFTENESEAIKFIGKRSVYGYREIIDMLSGGLNIINFRYLDEIKNKVTFAELINKGVIAGAPQTIQAINRKYFNFLKEKLGSYYQ